MKKYKSDKGSISVVVVVTILFFITILSATYASNANLRKSQLQSQIAIKNEYESELEKINELDLNLPVNAQNNI